MLIVDVSINDKIINSICIQNTGKQDKAERYIYDVYANCKTESKLKRKFHHDRRLGWKPLVLQVLRHIVSLEEKE